MAVLTYSYCDALSFAVMERLGVAEAIAFDRHFREYGCFITAVARDAVLARGYLLACLRRRTWSSP
jgi:predicted nucleic acid-binding protein